MTPDAVPDVLALAQSRILEEQMTPGARRAFGQVVAMALEALAFGQFRRRFVPAEDVQVHLDPVRPVAPRREVLQVRLVRERDGLLR